ncbi:hypothetical protein LCGC14_1974950 [marine sediment metagenome]|uniref:Uncharacterized protein n=1 Tax=marine sediment metagenome TaxID=412755 RepID=A0A0F9FYS9_9ZZZZ
MDAQVTVKVSPEQHETLTAVLRFLNKHQSEDAEVLLRATLRSQGRKIDKQDLDLVLAYIAEESLIAIR